MGVFEAHFLPPALSLRRPSDVGGPQFDRGLRSTDEEPEKATA